MFDLETIIAMNARPRVHGRLPQLGVVLETQDLMRQLRERELKNRVPDDDKVIYGETVSLSP